MRVRSPERPRPDVGCGFSTVHPDYREGDAPPALLDPASVEGRLHPALLRRFPTDIRDDDDAVEMPAALDLLEESAIRFYLASHGTLPGLVPWTSASFRGEYHWGQAFADLCVTGRTMYRRFSSLRLDPESDDADRPELRRRIRERIEAYTRLGLYDFFPATDEHVNRALEAALNRAYTVAWALRGDLPTRAAFRERLGWIAVSAEVDPPHRPVNVPTAPYPQYDLDLVVFDREVTIRYFVASLEPDRRRVPVTIRRTPSDQPPAIPDDEEIILFLHGHSSRAEEAVDLIPYLHGWGAERGTRYTVISLDLPSSGYSTMLAPIDVSEDHPDRFRHPALDFIEETVVRFIDALDEVVPIKRRMAAVIGGSLGGNLCLRLGRRNLDDHAWLATIAPWSPASVWTSFRGEGDPFKEIALGSTWGSSRAEETAGSRDDYFHGVFDKDPALEVEIAAWLGRASPLVSQLLPPPLNLIVDAIAGPANDAVTIAAIVGKMVPPQPLAWYRDDWQPCKDDHIRMARLDRREIYNARFRQWHWRVAHEQLLMSHWDPVDEDDTEPRYAGIRSRTLLTACEYDRVVFNDIYGASQSLARRMTNTPGEMLPVLATGHSIHSERPSYFARKVVDFLNAGGCRPLVTLGLDRLTRG